jgi:type IV secretion system protein VirB6
VPLIAVTAGAQADDMSCYKTNSDYGSKNLVYDEAKAFLCPEEWRSQGYKSYIKPNPDDNNKLTKFAVKGNDVTDVSENFLYMRQHDGPLVCKNGKVGDDINIFGYKYEIVKKGAKICAVLKGLDTGLGAATGGAVGLTIPSITGSFIIGCHYTKPDDPAPLCDKSIPIYAQNEEGSFVLDPATKEKVVLDYNNSGCFSCFIDESCHGTSASHSKAVMPLTSYVMECLHQTMNNVVMGCVNKTTGQRGEGMLTRANAKLKDITHILITLCIILFAFKILFSNNLPKLNEIMFLVLKIGVILYCIDGNSERNGINWFYKQVSNLSSGISSLVLRAASYQTQMCKFTDDMYQISSSSTTTKTDLAFIKPYDMLDCRLFFYLGGALYGYNYSQSTVNWNKIVGNTALRLINIIFPLLGLMDPMAFICGIFLLVFAIVVLGFAVWMLSLLVLSMIMLFFLILIAPIVLPMMLFVYTKGFFENWTKELIAYVLFPSLLFLFFGLVMYH